MSRYILDPFTGTGTFITRLLQSGLIAPEELEQKYKHEIHANEIVLLAYYIAAINIETVYHEMIQGELREDAPYHPFEGILLTDTFQMYEQERDMVANLLPDNSERRTRQKGLDIRVIIGNPPYSVGQASEDDNNKNIGYATLDGRIRETYAARSTSTLKNKLYDSYIRAIRWAADRIGNAGVMAFVTNAGWIDGNAADGMRKCLAEEFSDLYIFHLRGNQRTSGELSRKEGGKIFGSGSRAPIAISVLVKNPEATKHECIHFHDIGDYLDQKQKLAIIRDFGSVEGISKAKGWRKISPNEKNDWLDQRDRSFEKFLAVGNKTDSSGAVIFENYSLGVATNRDAWCVNFSENRTRSNIQTTLGHYEAERRKRLASETSNKVETIAPTPDKISWTANLKKGLERSKEIEFSDGDLRKTIYRPFDTEWMYFGRNLNERVYQIPQIFPTPSAQNLAIMVKGNWRGSGQLALMVNKTVCLQSDGGAQCFPLYLYEETQPDDGLFAASGNQAGALTRRDAITYDGLTHFQAAYAGEHISKEDLFYYIYGLLHSPDYRERFKNNLTKALPRIPAVRTFEDFAAFRDAGRALGDLHVNFETVDP